MNVKKIAIGSDHAGFEYKSRIIELLEAKNIEVKDFGTYSAESTDYADFAHPVCDAVEDQSYEKGILVCGSGQGVSMTANKHQGIRAALCWNPEIAKATREHNDANVLTLAERFTDFEIVKQIIEVFFTTEFEGGRHQRRIDKMSC